MRPLTDLLFVTLILLARLEAQGNIAERWVAVQNPTPQEIYLPPSLLADWDGDGAADLLEISSPVAGPLAEFQRVISGRDGSVLATPPNLFLAPPAGPPTGTFLWFARSFGLVDDLDGDAHADIAILREHPWGGAALEVRSGASLATITALSWLGGIVPRKLALAGDMNGDGVSEIAVILNLGGVDELRIVDPIAGTQLAVVSGPAVVGAPNGAGFGDLLVPVGDVDGDGLADILFGGRMRYDPAAPPAPSATAAGFRLLRGGSFSTIWSMAPTFGSANPMAGRAFVLNDLDGDTHPELMVESLYGSDTWAWVSTATGLTFASLGTLGLPNTELGSAGDVNGDGATDFAVRGRFVSGPRSVFDGLSFQVIGDLESFDLLLPLGDLNGDGAGELLLGNVVTAQLPPPGSMTQRVRALQGFERYGDLGAPLSLTYLRGSFGARIELQGATPNAALIVGVSPFAAPSGATFAGLPLAIDLGPTTLLQNVVADAFGTWPYFTPLQLPALAGITLYLQALEPVSNRHSNGLELLFQL
jgi:hypothetical protein